MVRVAPAHPRKAVTGIKIEIRIRPHVSCRLTVLAHSSGCHTFAMGGMKEYRGLTEFATTSKDAASCERVAGGKRGGGGAHSKKRLPRRRNPLQGRRICGAPNVLRNAWTRMGCV